jgi:signal transduction histidine kinase
VAWQTGTAVARGYHPVHGPLLERTRIVLSDPATWRDLGWLAAQFLAGLVALTCLLVLASGVVGLTAPLLRAMLPPSATFSVAFPVTGMARAFATMPIGGALLIAGWWACRSAAAGSARLSGWLLAPSERTLLRARMEQLAQTRTQTVDTHSAALRRIERDLHDGAQARLVALSMCLGMAEDEIRRDPEAARQLMAEAHASADVALTELRHLVRGIHPPVLTERGLSSAVQALALASAVPVDADVRLSRRLPAPLESALYFVIAEALANTARHSNASSAFVQLSVHDGRLCLTIRDNGRGGANPACGSGLRGIQRRLAAFDGQLTISSPLGGPTELSVELPCPP